MRKPVSGSRRLTVAPPVSREREESLMARLRSDFDRQENMKYRFAILDSPETIEKGGELALMPKDTGEEWEEDNELRQVVNSGKVDVEALAREAARQAITKLRARPAPSGAMPVVIKHGTGGVLFHEACGHGLEADLVAKSASVFADRVVGKPYIEIVIDREAIGRYGLTIGRVQNVIQVALGGLGVGHLPSPVHLLGHGVDLVLHRRTEGGLWVPAEPTYGEEPDFEDGDQIAFQLADDGFSRVSQDDL